MKIQQVNRESVDVFWEKVKDWVDTAVQQSKGRHTLNTTYSFLKTGQMTMFLVYIKEKLCAVYVVQKVIYPAKNVLGILFCGGSEVIKNIKTIEEFFVKYAKQEECSNLEIIGRKGWGKAIKDNNLKFRQTGFFYEMAT